LAGRYAISILGQYAPILFKEEYEQVFNYICVKYGFDHWLYRYLWKQRKKILSQNNLILLQKEKRVCMSIETVHLELQ
ncbi:hypothetical protein, partial [Vibrio anguillarum]